MESRWIAIAGLTFSVMVVQYFVLYGNITKRANDYSILSHGNDWQGKGFAFVGNSESTAENGTSNEEFQSKTDDEIWEEIPSKLNEAEKEILKDRLKQASKETKYILDWYGKSRTNIKPWPNETCGKCLFTSNQSMINHPGTGAVMFKYKHFSLASLPKTPRRRDQLHIWFTGEAPSSLYTMRKMYLASETLYQFNLTQTYKRDSSIYHPYGNMEEILREKWKSGRHKNISAILDEKTKLAVAVISNCVSMAGARVRKQFVDKMKELGLEVDTFGRCFDQKVTETHYDFERTLKKYKFYLAFENSYHCRDYITEKFYINGLRAGTVPVAMGAPKEDYEAIAPKDSFIFAEDFSSIAELVAYLNYLDKNDTAYLQYFKWIERGPSSLPMFGGSHRFCRVCRQLHGINVDDLYDPDYNSSNPERPLFTDYIAERKTKDLKKWYYYTENPDCFERVADRIKKSLNFSDFLPSTVH